MQRAWPQLPVATRRILELAYFEDWSQRRIAADLELTLGIVKSRLQQGLRMLREQMDSNESSTAIPPARSPRRVEAALTTVRTSAPDTTAPLRSLQVMVVDDHAPTCEMLEWVLTNAGANVIARGSADSACRTLATVWPDVLLSDVSMPGQDGCDFIRHVRAIADRARLLLPAIAFTARASERDRARALQAGFQVHISKPVHPSAIVAAVHKVTRAA